MKTLKVYGGLLLVLILLVSFTSAITGSIGNARMVLKLEQGESIERYILVKNVNNVSVNIELFATGDLENEITIKDGNFSLEPDSEKKAYFTIKPEEAGTTETNINIKFSPIEGKNGVGLTSTVVVVTSEKEGWSLFGGSDEANNDEPNNSSLSSLFRSSDGSGYSGIGLLVMILALIFVVLILIFILVKVLKTKPKKDVKRM